MARLTELGFNTATPIAYGSNEHFFLPHSAVLITLPVPGVPLDKIWQDESISIERRRECVKLASDTLKKLQSMGCDWGKDCKPEHFFISQDNQVHLIDVERMHFRLVSPEECAKQFERFNSLLDKALKKS